MGHSVDAFDAFPPLREIDYRCRFWTRIMYRLYLSTGDLTYRIRAYDAMFLATGRETRQVLWTR